MSVKLGAMMSRPTCGQRSEMRAIRPPSPTAMAGGMRVQALLKDQPEDERPVVKRAGPTVHCWLIPPGQV
jgi:hypothetical protein